MVFCTAIGGAVLAILIPTTILYGSLTVYNGDSSIFITGLSYAYIAGAILAGIAALTSLVRDR